MYRVKIGNAKWWAYRINEIECLSPTFLGCLETIKAYKEIYNV